MVGSKDHVSRKINWSLHNSRKINISRFTKKKNSIYLTGKVTPKRSLVRCLFSSVCFLFCVHQKGLNPSKSTKRDDCPVTVTQLRSKIMEDTTKITVHDELNTSFSFHRELFWKITVHEKKTSRFTFHEKKIRPFTNHENTFTTLYILKPWDLERVSEA